MLKKNEVQEMVNRRISRECVEVLQKKENTDVERVHFYITLESELFDNKKEAIGLDEKPQTKRPSAKYAQSTGRDIVSTLIGLFEEIDD